LRHSSWGRWNTIEVEFTENVVVLGHLTFSFEYLDQHSGLVVSVGGEGLRFFSGDGCVSGDEDSHHTSCSLDTEGERGDVNQKQTVGSL